MKYSYTTQPEIVNGLEKWNVALLCNGRIVWTSHYNSKEMAITMAWHQYRKLTK